MPTPLWQPGQPSPNPNGRPPGPAAPKRLLQEAFLRAAKTAGGGGDDGLHDYLAKVALTHPAVFVSALSKLIPFEVRMSGTGNVTINIVKRFNDEEVPAAQAKLINGHVNGNGRANGNDDPVAE